MKRTYIVACEHKRPDSVDMRTLFDDYDGVEVKEAAEVVPASDLRASEELVQRLAEHVAALESANSQPGRQVEEVTCVMNELFGLVKVNGKWERVK